MSSKKGRDRVVTALVVVGALYAVNRFGLMKKAVHG